MLKQILIEKVPRSLQEEPHFHALLDHIKQHNIGTKEHLTDFLKQETDIVEKWVEDNKNSGLAKVKSVRDKVRQLDVLKKCSELAGEFLL